jgi:hypothetical protein
MVNDREISWCMLPKSYPVAYCWQSPLFGPKQQNTGSFGADFTELGEEGVLFSICGCHASGVHI